MALRARFGVQDIWRDRYDPDDIVTSSKGEVPETRARNIRKISFSYVIFSLSYILVHFSNNQLYKYVKIIIM